MSLFIDAGGYYYRNGELVIPFQTWFYDDLPGLEEFVNECRRVEARMREVAVMPQYNGEFGNASGKDGIETCNSFDELHAYIDTLLTRYASKTARRRAVKKRRKEFGRVRSELVIQLIDRDGYICRYPGCDVREHLTIDHVVPLSKGGSDDLSNLQFLCLPHNSMKGTNTALFEKEKKDQKEKERLQKQYSEAEAGSGTLEESLGHVLDISQTVEQKGS